MDRHKNKKGLTLVEMLVAIGIFLIGMATFSLLFVRGWKTNIFVMEEGQSSLAVSRAVDSLINELRRMRQGDNGSYPIELADGNNLVVYIDIDHDGTTERVHYFLDENNQKIKKGITKPVAENPISYPIEDGILSDVLSYVKNSSDNHIFRYFGKDYPIITDPISIPVDASQIKDISLIRVNLSVDIKTNSAPDNITMESFAELRNINDYAN